MNSIARCIACLGLLGLLSQCQEKKLDFYRDATHGPDVWRLPILTPYELVAADSAGNERWNFQHAEFNDTFSADSVNLTGHYITFHDFAQASYGYCDLKRKKLVRLSDFARFADSAKARHFSPQLYHTESVYTCWRETGQLPWGQEILAARGCSRPPRK